jgi:hypothetical protein
VCSSDLREIFKRRLDEREKLAEGNRDKKEMFMAMGRAAHHIQDMSSPPHAVPIYHTCFDRFDKYPSKTVYGKDLSRFVAGLESMVMEPSELLDRAAKDTLDAVEGPVVFTEGGVDVRETWLKFWGGPPDRKYDGFGTYGEYGNAFGKIPPSDDETGKRYDEKTYALFFDGCIERAVMNTVHLLMLLDKNRE